LVYYYLFASIVSGHHISPPKGRIIWVIIFRFLLFPQKFLSVQFLLLLEFAAYIKKKLLFHSVIVQNISVASKRKKETKKKKKSFKKTFIGFCRRNLNKRKLDQINLELAQIWYSNYGVLIAPHIKFAVNWICLLWFWISGLIRSDSYRFCIRISELIVNCSNFIFYLFGLISHYIWNCRSMGII
jgi:hypothetical protein